jgi:hypothetical protein
MDAFYQIYNYSKILAVDMHIEVVNLDTVPYEFIMTTCQQGLISTITNDQAKQSPGAIVKIIGGSSGQNRITIRKHYNAEEIVGYHLADRDTRMTFADANSGAYADSSLPAIVFFPSLITGASTNGVSITVIQTYHLCFFDLAVPATSAVNASKGGLWPPEPPISPFEIEEDDDDICSKQSLNPGIELQEYVLKPSNVKLMPLNSQSLGLSKRLDARAQPFVPKK